MDNYCSNCGKPLAGGKYCPNCGKLLTNQTNADYTEKCEPSQRILKADINEPQLNKKGFAKGKSFFTFLLIILSVILFSIIYINIDSITNLITKYDLTTPSTSKESNDSEYITLDEYTSIKNGMTYEEVVKLIGSNGTSVSETTVGTTSIMIITWYGNGFNGSNANVTFTNGNVTGKAQIGLE